VHGPLAPISAGSSMRSPVEVQQASTACAGLAATTFSDNGRSLWSVAIASSHPAIV
jgi:hypothetical protein